MKRQRVVAVLVVGVIVLLCTVSLKLDAILHDLPAGSAWPYVIVFTGLAVWGMIVKFELRRRSKRRPPDRHGFRARPAACPQHLGTMALCGSGRMMRTSNRPLTAIVHSTATGHDRFGDRLRIPR